MQLAVVYSSTVRSKATERRTIVIPSCRPADVFVKYLYVFNMLQKYLCKYVIKY